jgi:glutathione S-transferase
MPTIHGIPLSPFTRKVCVAMHEKNIAFDLNPIAPVPPANDDPKFRAMSPLGKIPAFEDGDFSISDSSVILAYLERAHPDSALYPQDAKEYARAMWLEEFADSKLVEGVGPVFFERIVAPAFFQRAPDQAALDVALGEKIPTAFDYLESQLSGADYLVGKRLSVADIAIGAMLRQFQMASETVDESRWAKLAKYAETLLERESFKKCAVAEAAMMQGAAA